MVFIRTANATVRWKEVVMFLCIDGQDKSSIVPFVAQYQEENMRVILPQLSPFSLVDSQRCRQHRESYNSYFLYYRIVSTRQRQQI